jgi:hypothetical protein
MTAIAELLKDSAYKLGQFKPAQIAALESSITLKESGKKTAPYVTCLVRGNTDRHKSIVVESKAYTVFDRSSPKSSLRYNSRA